MLVERRQGAFPSDFLLRVGVAWGLIGAMLVAINWTAISAMRFPDPDDTMRLVQVRDLLNGQGWFDVTQYRVNAPEGGVAMHWSRLVDIPLALTIVVLTPIFGSAGAEMAALILVPLVTLGIAMLLAARIAWRLLGEEETTLTGLILAVCVPVVFQLGPMRIDHHGWQLVCALVAMNGLMARNPTVGGRVIGASFGVWLTISVEGLPLAAATFAVLALRWVRDRQHRAILLSAIQSLVLTTAVLFALTRGFGDFATYCDALSPLHIAMFGWGAVVLIVLGRLEPLPVAARLGGFAVAAGGALGLLLYAAPQCASGGGFDTLDPLVREHWYLHISEGMPVWQQSLSVALQYVVTPVIGLFAAINLASNSREWLRRFWGDYAMILAASLLISLLVARAGAVACLIAAPPLAWQLNRWLRSIRTIDRPLPRIGAMTLVACALLPTLPLSVSQMVLPARAEIASVQPSESTLKSSQCEIERSAAALRALDTAEIFAPLDIAPTLLLVSAHSVPATSHHRGDEGMRDVIATALGSREEARQALTERGSQYVAACIGLAELNNYAFIAPDSFAADLTQGRVPQWLEPVETAEGTSFRLWRITPDESSSPTH